MRSCLVSFVIVARLACSVHAQDVSRESPSNIRCESDSLREALRLGLTDSPTFRATAEELARSNLIIYLETNTILPHGLQGMLSLVTTAGGFRYVRISIRPGLRSNVLVAMIGHELRHAVEIARGRLRLLTKRPWFAFTPESGFSAESRRGTTLWPLSSWDYRCSANSGDPRCSLVVRQVVETCRRPLMTRWKPW
jgi:hypothetical protein